MKPRQTSTGVLSVLSFRLRSVPLFVKVIGISGVVAGIFASITLVLTQACMSGILHQILEQRALSTAESLAVNLESPMSTEDVIAVKQKIHRTQRAFSDVRYAIVRDPSGQIVASTFGQEVPASLQRVFSPLDSPIPRSQVLAAKEGRVFDVTFPILEGHAGTLQLGMLDEMVTHARSELTRGVLWGLVLCMMVAAGSAALLTNILTRPISNLGHAAEQLREGRFETRADVFSADEIGRLAATFNQMAEGLQRYRQEVQAKERARVALVEKTIHAQEEERKRLSRELHDQFAQSLTALLVAMQARCPHRQDGQNSCRDLDKTVRELIGEAHRMAWGLRPSILDDYGLDSALARHIAEVSQRSGVQIDYRYTCAPDAGRLPNPVEVTLFRVTQEALTNIVRHAQATRASVVVLRQGDHVALFVEDNGRGFDLASVQDNDDKRLGLMGMKERVALLGGVCALESTPGKGTTLLVRIPLNGQDEALTQRNRSQTA